MRSPATEVGFNTGPAFTAVVLHDLVVRVISTRITIRQRITKRIHITIVGKYLLRIGHKRVGADELADGRVVVADVPSASSGLA